MRLPAHVCVVRHGETDWNISGILQGWTDVPINEIGRRQARELAAAFAGAHFEEGETMDAFADRVLGAVLEIGRRHGGERVLVVTHGWVMDVITRHVGGLPRSAILNLKRKNGESVWLETDGAAILSGHAPSRRD